MILLAPSKEMAKEAVATTARPLFQKEAEELLPEIQHEPIYEAYSLYNGLAFRHFKQEGFTKEEEDFLGRQLSILSALYGVTGGREGIARHRLDFTMKRGLYAFWGEKIYTALKERMQPGEAFINLASEEFAKCLRRYLKEEDVFYDFAFYQEKEGVLKQHSTISKKARGAMARYLVKQQDTSLASVKAFAEDGYAFLEEESTAEKFCFVKREK